MKNEPVFVTQWKDEMKDLIKLRFKDKPLSDKKINKYLDNVIMACLVNPEVEVVNNYRNKVVRTDLLSLIDEIHNNDLIIGGGGVLYVQHNTKGRENIMYDYIAKRKLKRGAYKKKRDLCLDDSYEYLYYDILQNATKIIINSLYGVHGYEGFILFNKFIAESITNIGRQIICTAVMTFENFLSNGIKFNTENEVYTYFNNIVTEYDANMDYSLFEIDDINTRVLKRITDKCAFYVSDDFVSHITSMIAGLNYGQKVLLYYKNNLYEFSRIPWIYDKLYYITSNLKELKTPDISKIEEALIVDYINEVWAFYEVFVMYDYPIYDRVRKAMFTDRNSVLYVDTDSNFLGLNRWVRFIEDEVLQGNFSGREQKEVDYISVNLMAIYLEHVIDHGLRSMCTHMGVHEEHHPILTMKNEFYISRILFTEKTKKRYISLTILKEGKILKGGLGKIDIKGFDFKKSVTKSYIRDIYSDICENDILRSDRIDVEKIYMRVLELKDNIEKSLKKGENTFLKQANVQIVEHYKEPWSNQGIVAVTLWNTLCPDYAMELPTDCDIVPIKDLSGPEGFRANGNIIWKNQAFMMEFKTKFPEYYARLDKEIYNNPNELVRHMGLTSIAKPKNNDIPLPPFFELIQDSNKIVVDDLKLISPILRSLGLHSLKTDASTEYVTNIIDL